MSYSIKIKKKKMAPKKEKDVFVTKKIKGSIVLSPNPANCSIGLEASSAKTEQVPSEE
jgi:hypothetical protein